MQYIHNNINNVKIISFKKLKAIFVFGKFITKIGIILKMFNFKARGLCKKDLPISILIVEGCEDHLDSFVKINKTPVIQLNNTARLNVNLLAKLEFYNPTGSIKDRAANYILKKLLDEKEIDKNTKIIESSSGNYGVALSTYCKIYGLNFICVIDPLILPANEMLINELSSKVIKVNKRDINGGYLLTRLEVVRKFINENKNSYWINQYENPYNAEAYYSTIGKEICDEFEKLDYVFIAVSSCGTITGISRRLKEKYKDIKVIAVDIKGSVIFGGLPSKRNIPGIGAGRVPPILKKAIIDDVVIVDENETVKACRKLLKENLLFLGGSSGAVYQAALKYFENKYFSKSPTVLMVFPDGGTKYLDTLYSDKWCKEKIKN